MHQRKCFIRTITRSTHMFWSNRYTTVIETFWKNAWQTWCKFSSPIKDSNKNILFKFCKNERRIKGIGWKQTQCDEIHWEESLSSCRFSQLMIWRGYYGIFTYIYTNTIIDYVQDHIIVNKMQRSVIFITTFFVLREKTFHDTFLGVHESFVSGRSYESFESWYAISTTYKHFVEKDEDAMCGVRW